MDSRRWTRITDLFLELVTFGETHAYIEQIKKHHTAYRTLYGE